MKRRIVSVLLLCYLPLLALASPTMSWSNWVANLRQQAVSEGISPSLFDRLFHGMTPGKRQLRLDRSQPERRLTFMEYRKTRIDPYRIKLGKREYRKHKQLLMNIGKRYHVDPCVVVATWGLETSYGRYLGNFPVIKSLATLAYGSNRKAFFRKELLYALRIVQEGHVPIDKFKGEWAGASGQAQFLPSSWYRYAVDYTGDGHKNIWTNLPDALASVANYLHQNGWQYGQPWGFRVIVPAHFNESLMSLKVRHPMEYWFHLGVHPAPGARLPAQNLEASVIRPYGGPDYMVFKNFRVIMTYNNSTYYAGSIAYLADKICGRR